MTNLVALLGFANDLQRSKGIATALVWDAERGWRGCLVTDSGQALALPARKLRKLADYLVRRGGNSMPEIKQVIEDLYTMAREGKAKNSRGEVPAGGGAFMTPRGTG